MENKQEKERKKININGIIKKYYKNIIILIVGISLMSLGGAILVVANEGSDALMVYNQGFAKILNIKIGASIMISNILAFIAILFIDKKSVGLGTLAIAFILGPIVDFILASNLIFVPSGIVGKILLILLGFLIACLGTTLYINSGVGLSPFEGILIAIKNKKNWKFRYIKIVNDIIFFTIGYLLGGVFGIASICTVFLYGPLIDMYTYFLKKLKIIKDDKTKENNEIE